VLNPACAPPPQLATGAGNAKLFRFAKSSNDLKDPEAKDADGAFLRGIAKLKGKATVLGAQPARAPPPPLLRLHFAG